MKRYGNFTQVTTLFAALFLFASMNLITVEAQVERSEDSAKRNERSDSPQTNVKGVIPFDFPNAPEPKIEVNLTGKLIALAAKAAKAQAAASTSGSSGSSGTAAKAAKAQVAEQGQELTELLEMVNEMVKGIYVRGYNSNAANLDPMLRHYENKLKKDKWEVIAKVKEENETVQVSALLDQDIVRGLFVIVTNKDETFLVNIFGQIDFEKLGKLLGSLKGLNLPSLEDLNIKSSGESKEKVEDK